MSSVEKKITRSVVFQFTSFFITGVVSILFVPFTISKLGTTQYGIYEMVLALTLINALLEIGVGSTITNYTKKYYDQGSKNYQAFFWSFFWFKLVIAILAFLLCLLIAKYSGSIFKKISPVDLPLLKTSIQWFAIGVLLTNFVSFFDNIQNGFVRFDLTSIANIVSKVFYVLAFFIWLFYGDEINISQFCFLTFVAVPFVRLLIQILFTTTVLQDMVPKFSFFEADILKNTLNYLGGVSFITLIAQVYNWGIPFFLSIVAAPTLVGEYGIIKKVLDFINSISDMLIRPIMPASRDLLKKYSITSIVDRGTNVHASIVLSLTTFIIINSGALSEYYLQGNYKNFDIHLIIMALPRLFPSFIVMLMLYYGEGKTKINIFNQLRRVFLSLVLGLVGFYFYDFLGLLIGLTTGVLLSIGFNLNRFFNYYTTVSQNRFLGIYLEKWMPVALSIICYLIIYNWWGFSFFNLLLWNLLSLLIFSLFFKKEFITAWQQLTKT